MDIVIADDEWLVRESLISMLKELLPDCRIREACSGQELVELGRRCPARRRVRGYPDAWQERTRSDPRSPERRTRYAVDHPHRVFRV
ncbi:hypothetical protein LJK88_06000 [Paenibacillus sp. P26]|nr:hypothetical protein LJK88_06000 [Paenibacillus sp. P26]